MFKNAYFFGKNVKNRLSVGGSAPEPPLASGIWGLRPQTSALLLPPTITTLSSSFLTLNTVYYPSMKERFLILPHFCTYFSLWTNSV